MSPRLILACALFAGVIAAAAALYLAGRGDAERSRALEDATAYRQTRERIDDALQHPPADDDAVLERLRRHAGQ